MVFNKTPQDKPKGVRQSHNSGFTLLEVVIAMALFIIIGYSIYLVTANIIEAISRNQWRSDAVSAIENEIETVRNMDYGDVGIAGGYPAGLLQAQKTVSFGELSFRIGTTVRNIDDPFDGTQGGEPDDTAPADYKLVEFEAECLNCKTKFNPIRITTTVAPRNLETTTENGSLFINVFDSFGLPISGADVHVENSVLSPTITIDDETNNNGVLQLVDIPTSTQAYEITVSKNGYSSARTYTPGETENPNPTKPHATVAKQDITSISFEIDKTGTINVSVTNEFCSGIPGVDFNIHGEKLIGTAPDVYKYSESLTTGAGGFLALNGIEWDSYTITNLDSIYAVSGIDPLSPLTINPDSTVNLRLLMEVSDYPSLHVVVKDDGGQFIDDASVRLQGAGFDETQLSGRRSLHNTDWSGGEYSIKDAEVEADNPAGEIKLVSDGGAYTTSTVSLISQTIDLGTPTASLHNIFWNPSAQPPETGTQSLRIQIASNNDNSSWNFIGPDGTSNTYYSSSGSAVHSSHSNNRYFRYKVFLKTDNNAFTPSLEDVEFEFSSSCVPSGQVFFNGLSVGTYTITVSKLGFQIYVDSGVTISSGWQEYTATINH